MGFPELFLLAIGLSMDAFAVAICAGLSMSKASLKRAFIVGLYFGVFQAGMPLIGYFAAKIFSDVVDTYSHWIAFGLLCFLGGKMVLDGLKKDDKTCSDTSEQSLKPAKMLPLAIATSIDALAVGVSFAFLSIDIAQAVTLIGVTTLVLSMVGVKIGSIFGAKFNSKAQIAGGVVLVLIGVNVLLQHFGVLVF